MTPTVRLRVLACSLVIGVACADDPSSGQESGSESGDPSSSGPAGTEASTSAADSESGPAEGSGDESAGPTADCTIFPADNPWNTDISGLPVHDDSDAFIASIGIDTGMHPDFGTEYEGAPNGIPYVVVPADQPRVPVTFLYDDESDPGPYPIPPDAPIEGGPDGDGDRHILALDRESCMLYELFHAFPVDGGAAWEADAGAIFDLRSNDLRPDTWTSADAAGLPILPGLVRYDEVVEAGAIEHALRFTVSNSQAAYIHPATHYASESNDPSLPPMGLRLRMKADYDCSSYSQEVQVICAALKKYGMFVADNGSDWYLSGAPDPRWNDDALHDIDNITGAAFEVVYTGETRTY